MKKIFLFIILVMLSGCCKEQYNNHIETSRLEKINTIDTYNYKGLQTIYYDTTIIVLSQQGDTLKETKSKNKITTNDNIIKSDTIYISNNDSIQRITETIVKNELNEFQKIMVAMGITSLIFIICFITYKILRIFRK